MNPQQKNINIVHNCEEHLINWLKEQLNKHGISTKEKSNLSEILSLYNKDHNSLKQLIQPIQKWNRIKNECYILSSKMNGDGANDERLCALSERAAFEGQILWLTIREN